jgi:hypothetical protein
MLPAPYETAFERLLADVAFATPADVPLVPFWPLRGAAYDGELLVIGRSVNGWVEDWTAAQLRDPDQRTAAVALLRRDAEPADRDRMAWVTDLWGARDGYNTRRSAFWRVLSRFVPGGGADGWPGRLVWTNLYKVSPAAGWNPGADLQRAQRPAATELLRRELTAYAPRRVLALTGSWIDPFAGGLGLTIATRGGLVEGLGERDGTAWVVAKHPMGKPEDRFVAEVTDAFAELGRPLR